ncbi:MAG: hypothetical protein P8X65_10625 [Syntrophobacterales bacterium]|jgi:hypothetical protein
MDLKDSLRRQRLRGKEKPPFSPSLFSHVGGLVRRHHLGADFCRRLGTLTAEGAEELARSRRSDAKVPYEPPLFFLATPKEYQVIQEILSGLDNPYLAWAQSPEEILLSHPLWRQRPDLDPEDLAHRHFAALVLNDFI